MKANDVKKLETQIKNLVAEMEANGLHIKHLQEQQTGLKKKVRTLRQRLKHSSSKLSVSEHAVLRFIERSMSVDQKAIQSELIEGVTPLWEKMGKIDGAYPVGCGQAVVREGLIVTFR